MKKGTFFGLLFCILSLMALGYAAVSLTLWHRDIRLITGPTTAELEAEAAFQALFETETETEISKTIPAATVSKTSPLRVIWAGDSRTLGMQNAVKNDDIYIGAAGEGYYWLAETGLPIIKEAIEGNPELPVVFNFGVNDYDNLDNYLALYEALLIEYPDTHFYFLAVNPIEPTQCSNITNEEITDFNNHLKASFGDAFLDSFTYIMIKEIITIDGVHYSEEDYCAIYEYAKNQVIKKEAAVTN